MRALLVTPYPLGGPRGNTETVQRIARSLRQEGARVRLMSPAQPSPRQRSDLIHAFHAYRAGPRALALAQRWEAQFVVTLAGTEVNHDLRARAQRPVMRRVLENADAVIVSDAKMRGRLREQLPSVAGRVRVVPQAMDPRFLPRPVRGDAYFLWLRHRWRRRLSLGEDDFVFLYASGIGAVKDPLFLLRAFPRLHRRQPQARLLFVGPLLEPDYGRRFLSQAKRVPGALYRTPVHPREMPGLYAAADVLVSSSRSEGEGMGNSLLEAMGMDLPVLAGALDANRNLVMEGRTGLLFRTAGEFAHKAERLLRDAPLRGKLAAQARSLVRLRHEPEIEAAAHLRLYHRLLRNRRRG